MLDVQGSWLEDGCQGQAGRNLDQVSAMLDYPIEPKNDVERIIDGLRIGLGIALDAIDGDALAAYKGEIVLLLASLMDDPESAIQLSRQRQ